MNTSYKVIIEFTVMQNVESPKDLIDPHSIAQDICAALTTVDCVAAYNVIKTEMDATFGKIDAQ